MNFPCFVSHPLFHCPRSPSLEGAGRGLQLKCFDLSQVLILTQQGLLVIDVLLWFVLLYTFSNVNFQAFFFSWKVMILFYMAVFHWICPYLNMKMTCVFNKRPLPKQHTEFILLTGNHLFCNLHMIMEVLFDICFAFHSFEIPSWGWERLVLPPRGI